ncbi:Zn-dependent alcohol dehydrogenase [Cenarchaeum symbiosum A]|uniref:Zn-dependent alcohol dehydrogenase n=1 Tax=Cenarchaeum symbiosum (strain A) TaxID=414004 RepID=A0RUX6_CENSY|nr:Zn-dependent alcohol dehydrogenase [Cenarchaeum symbiosum A]
MAGMRAMVLNKTGPIEENPLELAEIERHRVNGPREVLLKIQACGVCHSQLHSIEGDWKHLGIPPALPTVPGHEVVGEVVETGPGVTKFSVGDHAGVSPLLESCMDCAYCTGGREYLCDSSTILGESMRGGYAEYLNVSEDFATLVPADMNPEHAAPLFCAGITAYKAVKAAGPAPGSRVGIFGIGGVGHMAVQFARLAGAEVTAVSRSAEHLQVAAELGASSTAVFGSELPGGPLDTAIVFAPSDAATTAAIRAVKKGGTIVVGTIGEIRGFVAFEEKTIRGTLIGSPRDMEDVIRIAHENSLQVVTERFPLEGANEALQKLKNSKIKARAVLVP